MQYWGHHPNKYEMRAHELLETISETEYGYWIKPNGEIIVVRYQNHEQAVKNDGFEHGNKAVLAGWVRVVAYSGWFSCDFLLGGLTPLLVRQMKKLSGVNQDEPFDNYELRWWGQDEIVTGGFESTRRAPFMEKLDALIGEK